MRRARSYAAADEREAKLKIPRFIGYSKYGDECDLPLGYSYGGQGFEARDGVLQAALDDLQVEVLSHAVATIVFFYAFYHTRVNNTTGYNETFLLVNMAYVSYAPYTYTDGIWVRYLPRDSSDTSYPTTWANIKGAASLNVLCGSDYINYQDGTTNLVIFTNANSSELLKWDGSYTGSTPNNIAILSASAPKGKLIELYEDRIFVANINGQPNAVYWSEKQSPTGWTISSTGAGYLNVVDGRGEVVSAIYASRFGLLIFKKDSVHRLYGSVPTEFQFSMINKECGAVNNKCVTEISGVVYFLDQSGIMYTDGVNFHSLLRNQIAIGNITPNSNNEGKFSLFSFKDYLYFYNANDCNLYKIDPRERIIVSVKSIGQEFVYPCWIPMYARCLYMISVGSTLAIRGLEEAAYYQAIDWRIPQSDFGDSASIKTVIKMLIRGRDGTVKITPTVDGVAQESVTAVLPTQNANYGGINAYTNIYPDGEFSSTAGLSAVNATMAIENGALKLTATGVNGEHYAEKYIHAYAKAGHTYFCRALHGGSNFYPGARASIRLYNLKSDGTYEAGGTSPRTTVWDTGFVFTITSVNTSPSFFLRFSVTNDDGEYVYTGQGEYGTFDKVLIIDLTATLDGGAIPILGILENIYTFTTTSAFLPGYAAEPEHHVTLFPYARGKTIGFKIEGVDLLTGGGYSPTIIDDIQIHYESEEE